MTETEQGRGGDVTGAFSKARASFKGLQKGRAKALPIFLRDVRMQTQPMQTQPKMRSKIHPEIQTKIQNLHLSSRRARKAFHAAATFQ